MSKGEKSPILVISDSQPSQERQQTYGIVEIVFLPQQNSQKWTSRKGGFASTATLAVASIVVGIVLIFSFVQLNTSSEPVNMILQQQDSSALGHVDITIPQGRLRGYVRSSRQDREYAAFYKVPYARPPIGNLRFKDPEPPTSWSGLRDEPQVGLQCIQKEKYPTPPNATYTTGDEDCLYANIYVPNARTMHSTPTYPVMMYIHGGGLTGNSSKYGADYLMDEDVIIVMFHFRLGPLGNLNTGDDVIRGNMGFKDMAQMLKWIRDNIASFGGDPKRVTVFGNSAGAMSVGMLMVSPMTEGLIHRAISQSGSLLCATAMGIATKVKNGASIAADAYNCPSATSAELLECLQSKSAEEITLNLRAVPYLLTIEDRPDPTQNSVFMPEHPYNLLKDGKSHPVPYIFGNVNAECIGDALQYLKDTELIDNLNNDFVKYGDEIVTVSGLSSEDMRRIKKFYFGEKRFGNESVLNMTDMVGDKRFVHSSYENAKLHAKVAKTYLYWFTKVPAKSYLDKTHPDFPIAKLGLVYHGDELQFLCPYPGFPTISKDDQEYFEFSKDFVRLWTHFAKAGQPYLGGLAWKTVDPDNINNLTWLEVNDELTESNVILERMQFWDQFTHKQLKYF